MLLCPSPPEVGAQHLPRLDRGQVQYVLGPGHEDQPGRHADADRPLHEVQAIILEVTLEQPAFGQVRIANECASWASPLTEAG